MNIDEAKQWERNFARQLGEMPGGFTRACQWPGAPIDAKTLGMVARGLRRLPFAAALWLAANNERPDLLINPAKAIDVQCGPGALAALARKDCYESADLSRVIEMAEEDGTLSTADIRDIQRAADVNAQNALEVQMRAQRLSPGPVED